MNATLVLPNGREIARPSWWRDQAEVEARDATLRGKFFVVNIAGNNGVGELWKCRRCKGRHRYMTASCIERPFNGLDGALYAIYQQAGDLAAVRSLDGRSGAADTARVLVREVMKMPDLATSHPETARRLGTDLSRFDVSMGGINLGTVEEIPVTLAQRLLDRINQSRATVAKLSVEGLRVN